jgi:hypothetical protein
MSLHFLIVVYIIAKSDMTAKKPAEVSHTFENNDASNGDQNTKRFF